MTHCNSHHRLEHILLRLDTPCNEQTDPCSAVRCSLPPFQLQRSSPAYVRTFEGLSSPLLCTLPFFFFATFLTLFICQGIVSKLHDHVVKQSRWNYGSARPFDRGMWGWGLLQVVVSTQPIVLDTKNQLSSVIGDLSNFILLISHWNENPIQSNKTMVAFIHLIVDLCLIVMIKCDYSTMFLLT